MLKNFQREEAYRRQVEYLRNVSRKHLRAFRNQLEQQRQLANFALTFAVVISVGAVIGFILQT